MLPLKLNTFTNSSHTLAQTKHFDDIHNIVMHLFSLFITPSQWHRDTFAPLDHNRMDLECNNEAVPVNSLIINTPGLVLSSWHNTYSLVTKFMPSDWALITHTSDRRNNATRQFECNCLRKSPKKKIDFFRSTSHVDFLKAHIKIS